MTNPQTTLREKHRQWKTDGKIPTSFRPVTDQMTEDFFFKEVPEQMMEMVDEYANKDCPKDVSPMEIKAYIQWYQKQLGVK